MAPPSPGTNFYPRPPRGGRPMARLASSMRFDFYPRPPRGGRRVLHPRGDVLGPISIHALREEGDAVDAVVHLLVIISIHALREEGDNLPRSAGGCGSYFYPRPPRGGRLKFWAKIRRRANFYPRPPRGGRRAHAARWFPASTISIHALREEGDQSGVSPDAGAVISIHALREEGDGCPRRTAGKCF